MWTAQMVGAGLRMVIRVGVGENGRGWEVRG